MIEQWWDLQLAISCVKVKVLPTKSTLKPLLGTLLRDISLNQPWSVPRLLLCLNNSDSQTDTAFETGWWIIWGAVYCRRTTLKLTNLPSASVSIILYVKLTQNLLRRATCVSLHATTEESQRELVQSRHPSFAKNCFFFLARGWNQCMHWMRNTNKKRRPP